MNHHTPGPWIVNGSFIKDESDNTIAQVHWRRNEEQEAANANLISAAPDLLKALAKMVNMMDTGDEHGAGSEWHTEASAAIAKSTGEQA